MEVLVPTGQESADLISIGEKGDPLIRANFALVDDTSDGLLSLTYEVKLLVTDRERSHGDVAELDLLVQHVHGSVESALDIVLHIVGPHLYLMEEAWVVRARSRCQDRRHDIILIEREPNVGNRDSCVAKCQSIEVPRLLVPDHGFQVLPRHAHAIFDDDHVWLEEVVLSLVRFEGASFCLMVLVASLLPEMDTIDFVVTIDSCHLGIADNSDALLLQHRIDASVDFGTHIFADF